MRDKRQNTQLELDFSAESRGEAPATAGEGTESRVAERCTQSPALGKHNYPNRRVRSRMHGGVGGRGCKVPSYPDPVRPSTE